MQATRLYGRQNPFDEAATGLAVAAEAAAAPQHGAAHESLHMIVGRLHTFVGGEGPQGALQRQQVLAKLRDARIVAQSACHEGLGQAVLERFDQGLQLSPRDFSCLKCMPRGEAIRSRHLP